MMFLHDSLILTKLNHPAIVKTIGVNFQSFSDPKLLQPTIITEYVRGESLKEKSYLLEHGWTPTKKYINLLGISDGLRYIYEKGISHGNLKSENILLDSNCYPHIFDFGLSKIFSESLTKSRKLSISGQLGNPIYLSPEILQGKEICDQSSDVYSFSIIAYEIVTGKVPFSELDKSISIETFIQKVTDGYRPTFPEFVSEKMKKLITHCWNTSPSDRPTFKEIFEELSGDFSYIKEAVDIKEIQNYLDLLHKNPEKHDEEKEFQDEIIKLQETPTDKPNESKCGKLYTLL